MPRPQQQNLEVHQCSFEASILRAQAQIKFPCKLFVAWKTSSNKMIIKTQNQNVILNEGTAQIGENLICETYMIFNPKTNEYSPKLTSMCLNLVSERKPNEEKMVGRVAVNLAQILNSSQFSSPELYKLQYCSAKNGYLQFSIKSIAIKKTELRPQDLDIEEFTSSLAASKVMSSQSLIKEQNPQIRTSNTPLPIVSEAEQNNKLITVIEQLKKDLQSSQKQKADLVNEVRTLQSKISQIQNDIVQQLLNQVRQETEKRISIENKLKQKLQKKDEQFDESERKRLQFESQLLELRFQLSQLKSDKETQDQILEEKQTELQRLTRQLEYIKNNFKIDASIPEISSQSHLFSNKQRQGFLHQIEKLQVKLQSTSEKLEDFQEIKQKFESMEMTLYEVTQEKQKYFEELKTMQKEKFKLQEEKKDLEDKVMKTGDSIMMDEVVEKLTSLQSQFDQLKEKLDLLESQNAELLEETKKLQLENQVFYNGARQIQGWEEAKKDINAKFQALLEQKTSVQNECSQAKILLAQKQKILQETLRNLRNITEEKRNLENDYKRIDSENKKMEAQIKFSKKSKEEDERQKDDMENEVIELNKVRAELSGKNVRLENEMKSYELKMQKTRREFQLKEQSLKEAHKQNDMLQHRINEQIRKAQALDGKMIKFAEKEILMKQDLLILEEELRRIFDILMEKQDIEAANLQKIDGLVKELNQMKVQLFDTKEKQLQLYEENQKLKQQIFELQKNSIKLPENPSEQVEGQSNSYQINRYKELCKLQQQRISSLEHQSTNRLTDITDEMHSLIQKNIKLEKDKQDIIQNKLQPLEKDKNTYKNKCTELEDQIRRIQHLITQKEEKLELMQESYHNNQKSDKQILHNKTEEIEKLMKRLVNMEKSVQKYEQKIQEQKLLLDQALGKLEKRQFEYLEKERGKLSNKKGGSQRIYPHTFEDPQPLSPPSTEKNIGGVVKGDIMMVCHSLKELVKQRRLKQGTETIIEALINKNGLLEQNFQKLAIERGLVQQNARKVSMQFAKIKAQVLKGKGNPQEKKQFLQSLKPCEQKVKQLISVAEKLSNVAEQMVELED